MKALFKDGVPMEMTTKPYGSCQGKRCSDFCSCTPRQTVTSLQMLKKLDLTDTIKDVAWVFLVDVGIRRRDRAHYGFHGGLFSCIFFGGYPRFTVCRTRFYAFLERFHPIRSLILWLTIP
uniref:Uncharacterized protein n=1 Tax=Leersia perrieri TaxID=77586 RepID=A0A0D9XQD4_9ORYZ